MRSAAIFLLFIFVLISCKKGEDSGYANRYYPDLSSSLPAYSSNQDVVCDIYGEWRYSFPFFSASLILNKKGRFSYFSRGCLGTCFSEGDWTMFSGNIILNSDARFGGINNEWHREISQKAECKPAIADSELTLPAFVPSDISFVYDQKTPDTASLFFVNERFVVKGRSLYRGDISSSEKYNKRKE